MNRERLLNNFLENIAGISDKQYQERVWVRAEGPECDDIDDSVGYFFDDGDPILEKYKEYGINDNQYEILMKLSKKLWDFSRAYGVHYPYKSTEKLISMPEWQEIRELAKEVLQAFNYQK